MYDAGARFVILLLRDPEVLERAKRRKNGATNPDRVLAFGRRDDLDLHTRRRKGGELLLQAVCDTREHGRSAREDHVAIQVTTDVEITLEDGVIPMRKA